ncbi:mycothiol synthase [Nakamurella flavida]|uniref:Mycothiol acetyltransferase n=1 Tax=Nakamurella flavida TaxID=363630 RepID=A0A938YHA3_9ACTN|nr:mycothiol synthase [Nakamurella flavida]MBM9477665.1 mycothiol synthase [Nakamurella flavida]MDP9779216.1 mycothiol synthase [Nakamurella flavida]
MSVDWRSGAEPGLTAEVRALVAAARDVDGVEPLGGHLLEALTTDHAPARVALRADDGTLLGLAVAPEQDPAELVVHPDHRGRGRGGALLASALDRAGRVWAHGNLPAAAALAERSGLVRVRTLLQMRRTGPPPVAPDLPAGVRLRAFRPGRDEQALLGVNARAFAWHPEQGRLDLPGLELEMAQDWFDPAGLLLAVTDDDTVLGFHWTKVHPVDPTPPPADAAGAGTSGGPIGEVYVLAVDPLSPIRRLGGALTVAGLDHLAGRGLRTVMLYVEADNTRAVELYERWSFTVHQENVVWSRSAGAPDSR